MNFKYAIFDLDGTIFNTQIIWDRAERIVLSENFGVDMDNDESGTPIPFTGFYDMFDKAQKRSGRTCDFDKLFSDLYDYMRNVYKNDEIHFKPYAKEFLEYLKANGVKTALATATPIDMCTPALERMKILPYFDALVCTDYVGKNKHYPDVYDKALSDIGGNKKEAVVFEDTFYCTKTLRDNGYTFYIIEDDGSIMHREKLEQVADKYIKSYKELM